MVWINPQFQCRMIPHAVLINCYIMLITKLFCELEAMERIVLLTQAHVACVSRGFNRPLAMQ